MHVFLLKSIHLTTLSQMEIWREAIVEEFNNKLLVRATTRRNLVTYVNYLGFIPSSILLK